MTKPGLGISFWSLYTLSFTIALPVFLYYNGSIDEPPQESATVAFFYLGLGIVSWLVAIGLYSFFFIRLVFLDKRRMERSAREGTTIMAKIIRKMEIGVMQHAAILDLRLAFKNLAGTDIELPYQLHDGKPYEKRFEVGNTIEMCVSFEGKNVAFVPRTMQVARNRGVVLFYLFIFLLLLAAATVYPVFSYMAESQGSGWRFLRLSHPWISVPLINLGAGLFIWLLFTLINKATGNTGKSLRMAMCGIKTTGAILDYSQTGMYINEQPQVQFEITYTDHQGNTRTTISKKIVSLLDIHKLSKGPATFIYLPEEPEKIVFYEDLTV